MKQTLLAFLPGLMLLPQPALAHLVSTRFGEFYNGLLHPLTTLLHLVPWIALALLCGLQQREGHGRLALILFPAATLVGALFGSYLTQPDWLQGLILASFLTGLLVVLASKLTAVVFAVLFALVGFSHGFANAEPGLRGSERLFYVLGVAVAAYLLLTLLAGASRWLVSQGGWGSVAVRAGGSWILATGILYIGFVLMIPTGVESP